MRTFASARSAEQPLGRQRAFAVGQRRQPADEIGAAVVDHEEMRALRVVGAAGGAPLHDQVGFRHDRLMRRRILEGAIRHGEACGAGHRDQHRLFNIRQGLALMRDS